MNNTPVFLDRDAEEAICDMEREPMQAPTMPYNEAANGGRWWEE